MREDDGLDVQVLFVDDPAHLGGGGAGIDDQSLSRPFADCQPAVLSESAVARERAEVDHDSTLVGLRGVSGGPCGVPNQTVNELPHPQPPDACGLLKLKPWPIMLDT